MLRIARVPKYYSVEATAAATIDKIYVALLVDKCLPTCFSFLLETSDHAQTHTNTHTHTHITHVTQDANEQGRIKREQKNANL